jgi:hypothetical protein
MARPCEKLRYTGCRPTPPITSIWRMSAPGVVRLFHGVLAYQRQAPVFSLHLGRGLRGWRPLGWQSELMIPCRVVSSKD